MKKLIVRITAALDRALTALCERYEHNKAWSEKLFLS